MPPRSSAADGRRIGPPAPGRRAIVAHGRRSAPADHHAASPVPGGRAPAGQPSRPTATSGSTTGSGCGTRTTRRSSPISRPRTPTPRRRWPGHGSTPGGPLRRDGGPDRGDRPVGAGAQGALALLQARSVEGSSYGIHCRRPADGPEDAEQILLDENVLAEGHDYFSLGNFSVSPDHRWLVYSTDTTGGERYTMRFRDLTTGAESDESIEDTSYGAAWANDNATVFYVRVDEAMRPFQLWRHRVGTDPSTDVLVIEEPDDHFYLGVGSDQGRPVRPVRPRLQGHLRGPCRSTPTIPRASSRSSNPGARASSTRRPRPRGPRHRAAAAVPRSSPTTAPRTSG